MINLNGVITDSLQIIKDSVSVSTSAELSKTQFNMRSGTTFSYDGAVVVGPGTGLGVPQYPSPPPADVQGRIYYDTVTNLWMVGDNTGWHELVIRG